MALQRPAARAPFPGVELPHLAPALDRLAPAHLAAAVLFVSFAGQAVRNLIGWTGFGIVVVALFALTVARLGRIDSVAGFVRSVPRALLAFVALSTVSLVWSQYRDASAIGIAAQLVTTATAVLLARALDIRTMLDALWRAMTAIIGLSFAFELFVSLVLGHPLLPATMDPGSQPASFYWSNDELFSAGPIQGIVANRNLLAFVALLGLVLAGVRMLDGRSRRIPTLIWSALFLLTMALTRSATVTLAVGALLAAAGVVLAVRYLPLRIRRVLYPTGAALILAAITFAVVHSATIFSLVGRDDDMSGRAEIWRKVAGLAAEHPLLGWGWVSYWAPWVKPFKDLVVIDGTPYLQAHNALLDVTMQLGLVGAAIAVVAAVGAVVRSWRLAVSPVDRSGRLVSYRAVTIAPFLLLGALLIQSLTESRLLIEGNWLLFVALAIVVMRESPPRGSSRRIERAPRTSADTEPAATVTTS